MELDNLFFFCKKCNAGYCIHMIPKDGKCPNCGSNEGFVSEVIIFQNGKFAKIKKY